LGEVGVYIVFGLPKNLYGLGQKRGYIVFLIHENCMHAN